MQLTTILGPYHSGSTALNCMLGKHPSCFAVGETYRIAHHLNNYETPNLGYRCSCKNGQPKCTFWGHVISEMNNFVRNVFEVVADYSGSEVIIDDSKLPGELIPYLWGFPIKVIHLSKGPERYATSCLRYKGINGQEIDIDIIMDKWVSDNKAVFDFCHYHNYERVDQKFIGLINNCEPELQKLCNFIGIEYVDGLQDYWENENHHILGGNIKVMIAYKDILNEIDQHRWDWCNDNFPEFKSIYRFRFSENFDQDAWKDSISKECHEKIWDNASVHQMATRLGYEKLDI